VASLKNIAKSSSETSIGFLTCLSLVVATMVGTGVYTSLGFQLIHLHSGFSILTLWALGGVISLCGALCYAELAAVMPRSGGEYTYFTEVYHPAVGFMAAFISTIAGFTAPIALSAIAFGSYLHVALPFCPARSASFLVVLLISMGHLRSLRLSQLLQNGATCCKFLLLGLFLLIGLWSALHHPIALKQFLPHEESWRELLHPSAGIALIFVLYAYSGWNASTYLAGEVQNRQNLVGLSLVIGTALVTMLYLLLNAIFLTAAPMEEMRGVLNVGSIAATHLLGSLGGAMMSGVISLGLLASISAMIWAGPRVTQRVGEDYRIFSSLARRSEEGIPLRATLLQLVLVLILLGTGSFEVVLVYAQVPLLLSLSLGVGCLFVLRKRERIVLVDGQEARALDSTRFRCPLYPLPPLLFIFCTLAALLYSAVSKPWVTLAGLMTLLIPLIFYPWIASRNTRSAS
jgi:APA family basic amino acid/polyamine antiporter